MKDEFHFEPFSLAELEQVPGPEPEELLEPIVPVPTSAPKLEFRHPELGPPIKVWEYRDAEGRLLGYMARFGNDKRQKTFLPLTYCRSAHGETWRAQGFGAPYPLYNLPELIRRPENSILVVRGEANVEAARILFPSLVAVSCPYGDESIKNADWSNVKGREIICFPHEDDRKYDFTEQVASVAYKNGALAVRCLAPERMAHVYWTNEKKLKRRLIPAGWDCEKALADGWSAEEVARHLGDLKALPRKAKPLVYDHFGRATFQLTDRGVEGLAERRSGGKVEYYWVWVCDTLEINGQSRSEQGDNWGKQLRFTNSDGKMVEIDIPAKDLAGDGTAVREALLFRGLRTSTSRKARELLIEYIATGEGPKRLLNVQSVGWHEGAFITANRVIGRHVSGEDVQYAGSANSMVGTTGGSADEWKKGPAKWATGNSRLLFAISVAFSAALIKLVNGESGGFHVVGPSSIGKTTLLHVAGSVWGGSQPHGYLKSWRTTDNAAEATANAHSDALLCLDEIGEATPDAIGKVAYMLANGQGKLRMGTNTTVRKPFVWRSTFLSTGEVSLESKIAEASGKLPTAGQEVRFINIQADAGAGNGLFENLHGFTEAEEFARVLKATSMVNYGHAAIEFLTELVKDLHLTRARAISHSEDFVTNLGEMALGDGQVMRVARKFAHVAAAGEMAAELGIVPWSAGEASRAVSKIYRDWLKDRGGNQSHEKMRAVESVRYFLLRHGAARVSGTEDAESTQIDEENWGFVKRPPREKPFDHVIFCFYPDAWRREVCKGVNPRAVANVLKDLKYLVHEKGRSTSVQNFKGRNHRVYAVKDTVLVGDEPQPLRDMQKVPERPPGSGSIEIQREKLKRLK